MITFAVVLFFIVLWWDVHNDLDKWERNIPVRHTKEFFIRFALLLPTVVLLSLKDFSLLELAASFLLTGSVWWLLFDGWYNIERGIGWWSVGSEDKDDSKFDKFLRKLPPIGRAALKISLIIGSVVFYLLA